MHGGVQNHSGHDKIGAPIWDIYELIKDIDPEHLGTCFDIGHATVEGGSSWPIEAKLMEPYLACVYVKDFLWKKSDKGWSTEWVPLGEGMVNRAFFGWLKIVVQWADLTALRISDWRRPERTRPNEKGSRRP